MFILQHMLDVVTNDHLSGGIEFRSHDVSSFVDIRGGNAELG